ncbi:hypothetical protein F511_12983 [Dorcoceras hygrometricum]|uniref:Uncharacterized protein n=1 Tax=Dorcoceras hygrometricum TaxID=472368 RepID=A0A2Z7BJ98_9LAMI|nr:hypothetical protein F511_12983 [Dorcoceras hygrometricum]
MLEHQMRKAVKHHRKNFHIGAPMANSDLMKICLLIMFPEHSFSEEARCELTPRVTMEEFQQMIVQGLFLGSIERSNQFVLEMDQAPVNSRASGSRLYKGNIGLKRTSRLRSEMTRIEAGQALEVVVNNGVLHPSVFCCCLEFQGMLWLSLEFKDTVVVRVILRIKVTTVLGESDIENQGYDG